MKHKRNYFLFLIGFMLWMLVLLLPACRTNTVYVPVETVRAEYKDRIQRDSIHHYDSVFVKMKDDTVWLEKYKYQYRDKLIRDSVFVTDSVQVPYAVKGDTEYVNHIYWWQTLLMILGAVALGFLIYKIYLFFKFS